MTEDYCKTCRFFDAYHSEQGNPVCKRHSPIAYTWHKIDEFANYMEIKTAWPVVDGYRDWCGDYEPKEESE